jgi:hypothetical protein
MVKPLPPGCRLTAIFDSCHSGTALDLPYVYSTEGKIKEPNLLAEAGQGLMGAGMSHLKCVHVRIVCLSIDIQNAEAEGGMRYSLPHASESTVG